MRIVFQEVVLDNPRFHESMRKFWSSPQVDRALASLSSRLEPFMRKLGAEVLGTPEGGITPEFARVLRPSSEGPAVGADRVPGRGPGPEGPVGAA